MSPQAGWILQDQIVPRLCSAIPNSVPCIGAEDHQELIRDGINMAARMIDRVESQGKLGKVGPGKWLRGGVKRLNHLTQSHR